MVKDAELEKSRKDYDRCFEKFLKTYKNDHWHGEGHFERFEAEEKHILDQLEKLKINFDRSEQPMCKNGRPKTTSSMPC